MVSIMKLTVRQLATASRLGELLAFPSRADLARHDAHDWHFNISVPRSHWSAVRQGLRASV